MNYFRIFGRKCYIKRDEEDIGKFDSRTNEGIFLGYLKISKTYRCYGKRLKKIVGRTNVRVDSKVGIRP